MGIKGLKGYRPFKVVLRVGISIATISSLFIWYYEVHKLSITFCWTSACFSNFVTLFEFPIEALKATAAILAIVALLHKSDETQKQILISESQNNFSNYFKHKEEFKKIIDANLIGSIKCDDDLLHKKIFKSAIDGDYSLSNKTLIDIERLLINLMKSISNNTQKLGLNDESRKIVSPIEDDGDLYAIYNFLHCHNYSRVKFQSVIDCNDVSDVQNYKMVIEKLVNMLKLLKVIVVFDHTKRSVTPVDVFFASFYAEKVINEIDALYAEILKFSITKGEVIVDVGDKGQLYVFERLIDIFSDNFDIDF